MMTKFFDKFSYYLSKNYFALKSIWLGLESFAKKSSVFEYITDIEIFFQRLTSANQDQVKKRELRQKNYKSYKQFIESFYYHFIFSDRGDHTEGAFLEYQIIPKLLTIVGFFSSISLVFALSAGLFVLSPGLALMSKILGIVLTALIAIELLNDLEKYLLNKVSSENLVGKYLAYICNYIFTVLMPTIAISLCVISFVQALDSSHDYKDGNDRFKPSADLNDFEGYFQPQVYEGNRRYSSLFEAKLDESMRKERTSSILSINNL